MADNKIQTNRIAPDDEYTIVCPYCFNKASGGDGTPFSHTEVEFRAESFFASQREIEEKLGFTEFDIDLVDSVIERDEKKKRYDSYCRFLLGKDDKYQSFWDDFEGQTTEQAERAGRGPIPWELPVIRKGSGIVSLAADVDGFVTHAVDEFGKITHRRVCPHCHNPLPLGYGKNKVKYISIIGITGAGKTVYISQLLRGMSDYSSKVGLNAYFTAEHVTNFIEMNKVKKGMPLPAATTPGRLSQPMFYDIVRSVNNLQQTDTIVLYDIAGENCRNANDMVRFSRFVEHSDGLVLLIDPKQLGFLSDEMDDYEVDAPSLALNTLHSVLESENNTKSKIPIAVCVSKSDMCTGILPPVSQEQVQTSDSDVSGLPKQEFDGKTFNNLSDGIKNLMLKNAGSVCQNLQTEYLNFNFFAVSAIGCACAPTEQGFYAPVSRPDPRRIEEPILWLFKQFGYIRSNTKVLRPFKIKHADRYVYKKPLFKKPKLIKMPDEFSVYEEDTIRNSEMVLKKNVWSTLTEFDRALIE